MKNQPNREVSFRELLFNKLMLIVIPVVVLLSYELVTSRNSAHTVAAKESASITSAISGRLGFVLDVAVADLNFVATHIPIQSLIQKATGQDKKNIERMLINQSHGFQYISAIRVFSANGELYYTSNPNDPSPINTPEDATHGDLWYSEAILSSTTNNPSVFITQPIRDKNQKIAGVALVAINLDRLLDAFRDVQVGPNASIALRRFENSGLVALSSASADGVKRTYSHQKISNHPLDLVVGLAEVDYLTAWRRQSISTFFVAVLLILGVTYLLAREARAQAQKNLNDQRLLNFSLAVEQSPNSIVITDLNGKINYVNTAFVRITGYSKEEAIDNNPRFLQSGETDPLIYRSMWQCLSNGQPWDGELINKRKNGEIFHEHLRVAPVSQPDGTVTGYIAIVEDISHRIALEQQIELERVNLETEVSKRTSELRTQEMRTIGILRAMLDGLIHIDQQGIVLMINDSALEIFGYTEQRELIGKNIHSLMPSGYRDGLNTHFHQYDPTNNSQEIGGRVEIEGLRRDGTIFPLELAIKALVDDNGLSFIGAVRDLTTQKRIESEREFARSEAERLAKVKSEFLANMSHEIRTPLNAIIGLSDLCLLSELNNRQRSYLDKIKIASDSLLHIINDVLDFSKIEAGKLQIEKTPFVLETIFDQLSSVVAHQAEKQGVELTFDIDDTAKVFLGDPLRLGQILINLSTNAIKFSNSGNVIVKAQMTSSDTAQAELLFSVTDQGIGMTPDQLSSIFNPFTQADASTTRKYGGTGLGLTICSRLVENMGGEIWATSTVGTGSVFSFTVKLGIFGADRRMGISQFAERLASNAHRPVLIVDDNAISLKSLCTLVGQLGLQCHAAGNTAAALGFVNGDLLPDYLVCLIDWKMAEADGIECIKRLRVIYHSHGKTPPPMILATTYSHSQELESIIGTIDGLLSKPVSSRHLYVEIANCAGIEDANAPSESDRRKKNGKDWSSLQQLNVLVAEDIEVNQDVIKELLASVGLHKVRIVNNGLEAIADVERHVPDLILMDCQMPLLDGYEATKRIRLLPGAHHLPIIALTANATLADQEKCFEAGMNGHVAKPIRMEVLFEQISRCLPDSRLKQQISTNPEKVNLLANPPNFPGINFDVAITNVGGSFPFLLKVLKKFRDNQGANFKNEFNEAIDKEDWESIYRHAHSLKGVSKTLGAMALSELSVDLQNAATKRDVVTLTSLLDKVNHRMDEIVRGLGDLEQLIEGTK